MLHRSGWATVSLLMFLMIVTALVSAEDAIHSYSVSIHEDPELIQIANELMQSGSSAGEVNGILLVPNIEQPFPGTPYSKKMFEEYGIQLVDSFEEMQASISPGMCIIGATQQSPDFFLLVGSYWYFDQLFDGKTSLFINSSDQGGVYGGKYYQISGIPGTGVQTLPLLVDGEFISPYELFTSNNALAECVGIPILNETEDEPAQWEYPQWEYMVEDMATIAGLDDLQKLLDQYSQQGWRLLLIENEMIVFERPYDNR